MEVLLRKFALFATVVAVLGFASLASAQQGDAMFGFGTLMSSGSCNNNTGLCPEKGGLYPNVGADVIFHKRLGIGFDVAWRGGQGNYAGIGLPYRPILYTFNGVYQPHLSKKTGLDLFGGIGWQSTRLYGYQSTTNCVYFGACYTSANHFLVNVGGGIRYYVWGHVFLRPEVRYYHILNNTDTSGATGFGFTSNNVIRVGASIGYTIGPE